MRVPRAAISPEVRSRAEEALTFDLARDGRYPHAVRCVQHETRFEMMTPETISLVLAFLAALLLPGPASSSRNSA